MEASAVGVKNNYVVYELSIMDSWCPGAIANGAIDLERKEYMSILFLLPLQCTGNFPIYN
jgi:hypothetical protein